ncbi:hypothetical protein HDR59_04785 [bacterium]|nr:hypothetical protein [bacterium]
MNKLKLSLIAIATFVASNSNAQTFYQCVPNGCPNGQYFDGANCKALPATHTHTACANGKYFDGVNCKDLPATYTHPVCADGQYYNGQSCKNFPKYCSEVKKVRINNAKDPTPAGWNCFLESSGTNASYRDYLCARTYLCN